MLNSCQFIGNLGAAPEIRSMQSGDKVANLSIGVTNTWKDKNGQKQTSTEWVKVVVFSQGLVKVCESYLNKGDRIYIEGEMKTRSWEDNSGQKKYTTEIVLNGFNSKLIMLGGKPDGMNQDTYQSPENETQDDMADDIPF